MQNTKTHILPITGDPFRGGNPASPSPNILRAKRRCFDSREIPGKQLFLRSHLLYRHSKEQPARSWEFPRTVSATRGIGMERAPGNLFSWNSFVGRRSIRKSLAPESRRRFTRSAGMVSILSSTPWPANAEACQNSAIHADNKTARGAPLVLRSLVILDGYVLVVRCPGHRSFNSRCMPHNP